MLDIGQTKKCLRQKLRKEAKAFEAQYLEQSSQKIEESLLKLPLWQKAQTVFLFISMGTEPNTHGLVQKALSEGKRVAVPLCFADGIMQARQIFSLEGLVPKSFGILEPDQNAPLVLPQEFELVVAPCVAADEKCFRLGNGGGYYDRYLAKIGCPVLCLCRGKLLQKHVPHQSFDIPADYVLTENALWGGC